MNFKRLKLEGDGALARDASNLASVLSRLHALLATPSAGKGLDEVLEELQSTTTGSTHAAAAWKAIASAQEKLQAAIVGLQMSVDSCTPPAGYQPPQAGDETYVRGLLSYAHRLSYSSAAPLGYQPGQPLYFFKPPAPQEAEMRVSQLHTFNREWEARQLAVRQQAAGTAATDAQPQQETVAPPVELPGATGGDLAATAAQLGLDVQQLLASMPAGWKPGDPLPPAAGSAGGASAAAAAAAAGLPSATAAPAAAAATAAAGAGPPRQHEEVLADERAPAVAPPVLTGIFLDDFGQYTYDVSSSEGGASDDDSDSDGSD